MSTLDPVVLFFLLGLVAGIARSDLRLPSAIYDFLTVLLLLAIGLKGGVELARQSLRTLLPQPVPRSGIGLNELPGASLLAGTVGRAQCKQPTEAALLVRALIELSVVSATKAGLATNLPQANLATQAAPVRSRTAAA